MLDASLNSGADTDVISSDASDSYKQSGLKNPETNSDDSVLTKPPTTWNACAEEFVPDIQTHVDPPTSWNACAEDFVPDIPRFFIGDADPEVTEFVPSQLNADAKEFTPVIQSPIEGGADLGLVTDPGLTKLTPELHLMNAFAKEFTPGSAVAAEPALSELGQSLEGWQDVAERLTKIAASAAAEEFVEFAPQCSKMNGGAKEFTPGTDCLNTIVGDPGLAQFGQSLLGWQGVAEKLSKISIAASNESVPAMYFWDMAATDSIAHAINPAFLSDDESDHESISAILDDFAGNDGDNESNSGSQECNMSIDDAASNNWDKQSTDEDEESTVAMTDGSAGSNGKRESGNSALDIRDDFACNDDDKLKEGHNLENNESDKDTTFNESDKDTSLNGSSDTDPRDRASSMDDSTSMGTASDWEAEDAMHSSCPLLATQVRAPPGLHLPPWKLAKPVSSVGDATSLGTANDSEVEERPPLTLKPWTLPPWKKAAGLEAEAKDVCPLNFTSGKLPPWRQPRKLITDV